MYQITDQLYKRILEINSNVKIRQSLKSDANNFTDLMNKQYVRKRTNEYYYWQYYNSVRHNVLFVGYVGDNYIGSYGLQVNTLSDNNKCGVVIDLLIEEEYRKKGIFILFEKAVRELARKLKLSCLISLCNESGLRAHTSIQGWEHVGTIKSMILNLDNTQYCDLPSYQIDYSSCVYFEKNDEYIDWRFKHCPCYNYEFMKNENDIIVVKIFTDPIDRNRYGDIVDIFCNSNDSRQLINIYQKAFDFFNDEDVNLVTTWALPFCPLRPIVSGLGFAENSQERFFCINILQPSCNYLTDFNKWHLTQSDTDLY
jgi:hypothetical protein